MNFKERLERSVKITAVIMLVGMIPLMVLIIKITSYEPTEKPAPVVPVVVKATEPDLSSVEYKPLSPRYPGADYVTERFIGNGTQIIFILKGSYTDVTLRVNGNVTSMGSYGNCLTVDACYDYKKGRVIFNNPPVKGSVIAFTGTIL